MKNFRYLFIFATLVLLVGISARSDAVTTTVFQDDFEYASAVSAFPTASQDADPAALVGQWSRVDEQNNAGAILEGIQVTNATVPGPAQGQKYLGVQRVAGGFAIAVGSLSQEVTSTLTVEFDFYLVGNPSHPSYPYNMLSLYMQPASTFTGWTGEPISIDFRANGWVRAYGSSQQWTAASFARDQWVHVKLEIDFATQTYDITLGNSPTEFGFAFASAATGLGNLIFYAGAGDTTFYIDNVIATADLNVTPPPSVEIFKDGFENVTPVAFPDSNTLATPVAQIGTWSSLHQQDGSGGIKHGIQVTDNAVPGPVGDSDSYLAIQRVVYAWAAGTFTTDAGPDKTTIEFDLNLTANANAWAGVAFTVQPGSEYDSSGNTWAIYDFFLANGQIKHYYDGNWNNITLNTALPLDQWVHVKYNIDFVTHTYDMSINASTVPGLAFMRNSDVLNTMAYYGGAASAKFYLDNVVVKRAAAACNAIVRGDFNEDCKVNFEDLAVFVGDWLECNLQPASLCSN